MLVETQYLQGLEDEGVLLVSVDGPFWLKEHAELEPGQPIHHLRRTWWVVPEDQPSGVILFRLQTHPYLRRDFKNGGQLLWPGARGRWDPNNPKWDMNPPLRLNYTSESHPLTQALKARGHRGNLWEEWGKAAWTTAWAGRGDPHQGAPGQLFRTLHTDGDVYVHDYSMGLRQYAVENWTYIVEAGAAAEADYPLTWTTARRTDPEGVWRGLIRVRVLETTPVTDVLNVVDAALREVNAWAP